MTPEIGKNKTTKKTKKTKQKKKTLSVKAFVEPSIDHLTFAQSGKKLDDHKVLYHFSKYFSHTVKPCLKQ